MNSKQSLYTLISYNPSIQLNLNYMFAKLYSSLNVEVKNTLLSDLYLKTPRIGSNRGANIFTTHKEIINNL